MKTIPLLLFSLALFFFSCRTEKVIQGDEFVNVADLPNGDWKGYFELDPRIDTAHVYKMRIVKCEFCDKGLTLRRYAASDACHEKRCSELDDFSARMSGVAKPVTEDIFRTHYFRFIDGKRVVYGVRKGKALPEQLDLSDFRRRPGAIKFARGYYYVSGNKLVMRLQDRRNKRTSDWYFAIENEGGLLRLHSVTTYDAHEDPVNADRRAKEYRVGEVMSYSLTFHKDSLATIPLKTYLPPCLGRGSAPCDSW